MPLRAGVLGHFGLPDRSKPGGVAAVALPFSALPPASTPPPPSAAAAAILSTLTTVVAHFLSAFPPLERGELGVKVQVGLDTQRNWQLRAARRPTIGRIEEQREGKTVATSGFFFFFFFAGSSAASCSGAGTWVSLRLLWKMGTGSALLFTIDLSAGPATRARALACPRLPGLGGGAGAHLHPTSLSSLPRSMQFSSVSVL